MLGLALLGLALLGLLSSCVGQEHPEPIPAVAVARQCPAYPLPPAALLKRPVKLDFLPPES